LKRALRVAAALCAALLGAGVPSAAAAAARLHAVVVAGLGGEPQYESQFGEAARAVAQALGAVSGDPARVALLTGPEATAAALEARLRALRKSAAPGDALAVVLIGHGSYDGEQYKLNLPGPDVSAAALARWLDAVPAKQQLVVNTTSASGAALEALKRPGRWLISATRSGSERSATQFARYWAEALASASADLDKDGWISARESFEYTSRAVADHYTREVSLATEHPQLAGENDPPFRVGKLADARALDAGGDPELAALIARRDALERELAELRERKADAEPVAYLQQLEALLLELAQLEEQLEVRRARPATPAR
jgi:hypothetical protein